MRTTSGLHIVRRRRASGDRWYVYAKRGGPLIHCVDGDRPVVTDDLRAKAKAAARAVAVHPHIDDSLIDPLSVARACVTAYLAAKEAEVPTPDDMDWLEGEFMSLSYSTQSEFSCSAEEDGEYQQERERAGRIFAQIRAMIAARPKNGEQ